MLTDRLFVRAEVSASGPAAKAVSFVVLVGRMANKHCKFPFADKELVVVAAGLLVGDVSFETNSK